MGLRLKLVLAFAAVASLLLGVGVSSFFTNREIQFQVSDLRARHDVDLSRLDLEDVSLEIEGFWDPAGAFVATDIAASPGKRRPKLRGPIQRVDSDSQTLRVFGIDVVVDSGTEFIGPGGDELEFANFEAGDRIEFKARVEDGVWHAREIRARGVKHSDKIKATPTRVAIDGIAPESLEIHGLTISLAPYNADSPESALQRIELATGMALALQECRVAAQVWVGRGLSSRPLRDLADFDEEDQAPITSGERFALCTRDFSHYLDQSSGARLEGATSPGAFARRLHDLRERSITFAQHAAEFSRLAEARPREAQRFLDTILDPFLSHDLLLLVFAYQEEAEEALEDQVRGIAASVDTTTRVALLTSVAAVLLSIVLGVLIWRSIHVPIRDLAAAARRIGGGEFDTRVEVGTNDELGLLASAFNQMALQIATSTVSVSNLENIFDSMAGGLIICDPNGAVTSVNSATEDMLGYSGEELVGRSLASLYHSEDVGKFTLAGAAAQGATSTEEVSFLRKDGSSLPASLTISELRGSDGASQGLVCVAQDLSERKRMEEQLRRSLGEKEMLLGEIHHRVKNNLQVVSSLLEMQSSGTQDPKTLAQFAQSQNRIRSMALIHEQLCETSVTSTVDLDEYLGRLVDQLVISLADAPVSLDLDLDHCETGIDEALTCGLIANELVTNSLKHAFPAGSGGHLRVSLHRDKHRNHVLEVADDGVGLNSSEEEWKSLGLSLVKTLVRQLGGELQITREGGTCIRVAFPSGIEVAA